VTCPTETPYTSLHDVFACFATPSVMWKPMEVDADAGEKVTDSLKLAFDDAVSKLNFVLCSNPEVHHLGLCWSETIFRIPV
jgi:hypothetical protein